MKTPKKVVVFQFYNCGEVAWRRIGPEDRPKPETLTLREAN